MLTPKFHPNRSIDRRVIAFPTFCNMAAVRHLEYDFLWVVQKNKIHIQDGGSITLSKFGVDPVFAAGDITIL